jgi:hypothetical protein
MNQRQHLCLKRLNWDYDISPEEIFAVINGEKTHAGHWDLDALLVRMLERLSWYDLLDFFTPEFLAQKLTTEFLKKVYAEEKRAKYERLAKILRGETVPFTKWGSEYREQCKNTLFSNRWYST